jgi:FKBP-type peptidyl-prolyl cis-trans isomerase SlpA
MERQDLNGPVGDHAVDDAFHSLPEGEASMRTSQLGDRVRVHYAKKFEDGSVLSSRAKGHAPLEVIVGTNHPRLPGLGSELVGLAEGKSVTVRVPAERAYGMPDPTRIRRVDRARFPADENLTPGNRIRMRLSKGRTRPVRVLEIHGRVVVVDVNHPRSGQSVEMEVELIAVIAPKPGAAHRTA